MAIAQSGRYTEIFLLTDYDPSGLRIEETIRVRLSELVAEVDGDPDLVTFTRLGLTKSQIES